MTVDAGTLRHYVSLERPDITLDDQTGAQNKTWTPVKNVYAAIEPLSGREFVAAASVQSSVTTRVTIRYTDGLRSDWRIVHRGRIYNIRAILADRESGMEYLTLPCSEGSDEG